MNYPYQFPETIPFRAMEATAPDFDITEVAGWEQVLYMNWSKARGTKAFEKISGKLGYFGLSFNRPSQFNKMLFSGHKGSGKTTELRQFSDQIRGKGDYLVIEIPLEHVHNVAKLEPEDVYILCILQLLADLRTLNQDWLNALPEELLKIFEHVAQELLRSEQVSREISNDSKASVEAGTFAKMGFWQYLGIEAKISGAYTKNEKVTRAIRDRVKDRLNELIQQLNIALIELRLFLERQQLPSEILFVIDGFEKTLPPLYKHIFIDDTRFISQISAHVLCCVPIKTYYDVQTSPAGSQFQPYYLPMLRPISTNNALLRQMVEKRASVDLFAPGVLDYLASFSGGSPRQMLILVNSSILDAIGDRVEQQHAEEAVTQLGVELYRILTSSHRALIALGKYDSADADILNLVYSGVLLEYNGSTIERKLNPVLRKYFPSSFS